MSDSKVHFCANCNNELFEDFDIVKDFIDFSDNPTLENRQDGQFFFIYKIRQKFSLKNIQVDPDLNLKYFLENLSIFKYCTYYEIFCRHCQNILGFQIVSAPENYQKFIKGYLIMQSKIESKLIELNLMEEEGEMLQQMNQNFRNQNNDKDNNEKNKFQKNCEHFLNQQFQHFNLLNDTYFNLLQRQNKIEEKTLNIHKYTENIIQNQYQFKNNQQN